MLLRRPFAALWLCTSLVAASASAQSVGLNQYQGAPAPDDGFAVMRPGVPGHLRFSARLHVDYANDPLVFEDVRGQSDSERTSVVRDQLTTTLALSLGLAESWMIYATLPVDVLMKGEPLMGLPRSEGTGLGDMLFGGRFLLFAPQGEAGPMIALDAQLAAPTARAANRDQQLAGEDGVSGTVRGLLEVGLASLRVSLAAGLRFRPNTVLAGTAFRDELTFDLSLMQPLVHEQLFAHVELFGKSTRDDFGRIATTPISGLAGLRYRVGGLTFGLAGGAGITRGYGAPDARVVFSAAITVPERPVADAPLEEPSDTPESVESDAERPLGTENVNVVRAEASEPEPAPAAPVRRQWVDSDGDGLRDQDDQCPRAPGEETQNGCPKGLRLDLDAHVIEVLEEIKFGRGSTQVLGRSFPTLEELLAILNANPDMHVRIEAHTHNEEAASLSYSLTEARAGSIRDLLLEWGADLERIHAYGCGSVRPIAPNDKSWGRKKNERIELHVSEPGAADPQGCRAAE